MSTVVVATVLILCVAIVVLAHQVLTRPSLHGAGHPWMVLVDLRATSIEVRWAYASRPDLADDLEWLSYDLDHFADGDDLDVEWLVLDVRERLDALLVG